MLENPAGRFYVGSTDDLERRVAEHNSEEKVFWKYTHKNGPWRLVWAESHKTRGDAMKREKQIKRMKSGKWVSENLLNWQSESRRRRDFAWLRSVKRIL